MLSFIEQERDLQSYLYIVSFGANNLALGNIMPHWFRLLYQLYNYEILFDVSSTTVTSDNLGCEAKLERTRG